ncbi:MAG: hypothetical protein WKG32_15985 [Gemmatimonadaceae bacterium]
MRAALLVALLALATSGCATTGTIRTASDDAGTARTFAGEYDRVLTAAREAVVESGFAIEETKQLNDSSWYILGKKGMSFASYGELVRVTVQRAGASEASVRVYTQKRVKTNVFAKGDYSKDIFSSIEFKLRKT